MQSIPYTKILRSRHKQQLVPWKKGLFGFENLGNSNSRLIYFREFQYRVVSGWWISWIWVQWRQPYSLAIMRHLNDAKNCIGVKILEDITILKLMMSLILLLYLPAVIIHKFKEGSTWHISSRCEASPKIERASPRENKMIDRINASTKCVFRLSPQKQHIVFFFFHWRINTDINQVSNWLLNF